MKDINELLYEELVATRKDIKDGFEKMNGRVRKVEDFQSRQKGVMAAGGVLVTVMSWIAGHWGNQ